MVFHSLVIALLIAILAALALMIVLMRRQSSPANVRSVMRKTAEEFGRTVAQHAEINAVIGVLRAMDGDSDYRAKLAGYSGRAVAAALKGHIDALNDQLAIVRRELSIQRSVSVQHSSGTIFGDANPAEENLERLSASEASLMQQLGRAHSFAEAFAADRQDSQVPTDTVAQFCECKSFSCARTVRLPLAEVARIKREGLVIVLDGCNPEPGDQFVEMGQGYRLFRESR